MCLFFILSELNLTWVRLEMSDSPTTLDLKLVYLTDVKKYSWNGFISDGLVNG